MTDAPIFDVHRLIRLGRVSAVVPSPCGMWAAVAVARLDSEGGKYVSDLWRVPLDGSGEAVRLTRGDSDDRAPCFRRDGGLGFLSNRNPREGKPEEGDDERSQVWLLPTGGGEPVPLTDEPLGVSAFRFAQDADRLIVVAEVLPGVPEAEQRSRALDRKKHGPSGLLFTRSPVRLWDHWLGPTVTHLFACDEHGRGRRDLTPNAEREHLEVEWDLSRDGRLLAFTRRTPGEDRLDDVAIVQLDLESGEQRVLAEGKRASWSHPLYDPSGRQLAVMHSVREDRVGKPELWVFEGDARRQLAAEWDRWPNLQAWTPDGSALVVTADDRGVTPVFRIDAASGAVSRITGEASGGTHEAVRVTPDGKAVVGIRARFTHPPEPFRAPLESGAVPELLANLSGFSEAEGAALASWESLSTPSDDGAPVQYYVLRPASGGDVAHPALMWIHGGPIGQWGEGWHWRWNPLAAVAQGYVVAMPNPRGSTGCGQEFVEGIWGNSWGGQCYRDVMAAADALAALPYVDRDRIAAMGGSFGGYMTNWIGGQQERFRCLITHASLFSLPMFQGTTDFPVWFTRHLGGKTPYEDPAAYELHSPHRLVRNWKTPTLVIHGEKDYRVPIGEGLALFEALQHQGAPSELLVFPDENHWILKPRNVVIWYETVLAFLGRHLDPAQRNG